MRVVGVAIACAVLGACYQQPSLGSCKYQCGGANNDACPSGYTCNAGMCVAPGEGCDGDGGVIDAPPGDDATIDSAVECNEPGGFDLVFSDSWINTNLSPKELVLVDANDDQVLDVAVRDPGDIQIFFGVGNGVFSGPHTLGLSNAKRLLPGDWDQDGKRDDLLVLGSANLLYRVTWSGSTFSVPPITIPTTPNNFVDIAGLGDVSGDGFDDFAGYFDGSSPVVQPFIQNATGFTILPARASVENGSALISGHAAGDTKPDVFVLDGSTSQFAMHVGTGTTQFDFGGPTAINVHMYPVDGVVGLVHAMGARSVITASSNDDTVSIRRNMGGPTSFSDTANPAVGMKPVSVILADIGGSSLPDIITANESAETISVLINVDGDNWMPQRTRAVGEHPVDVVSADLDGDGRNDLLTLCAGNTSRVEIYFNRCPP